MYQILSFNHLQIFETVTTHPDFPIVIMSVLIGGFLTLIANYILMLRRIRIEKIRLRRAFKTEIQQLNIQEFRILITELNIGGESPGVLEQFINRINEVSEAVSAASGGENELPEIDPVELNQKALVEVGDKLTEINLSTEIYESNTDKIGKLTSNEIDLVIRFYKHLEAIKADLSQLIETAKESLNGAEDEESLLSYESQIQQLANSIEELEELEQETINELEKGRIRRFVDSVLHYALLPKKRGWICTEAEGEAEEGESASLTTDEWYSMVEEKLERLLEVDTSGDVDTRDHEILQSNFEGIPPELMELALNRDISIDSSLRESLIEVAQNHTRVAAICTREDFEEAWPEDDEDAERIKIEVMFEEYLEDSTRSALEKVRSAGEDGED